ncbi:hypothetical protein DSM110277_02008 [Sulfitobacter pontiacus]|uniref:Uncharacterized protein n=1 Tax=Sulfitobacter pontiacus TaxID=60137 RepID=A0AAX3ACI1_9RHOB|nr:hypothetical protein [Sulfitobacter pontiacus]UOA23579.1 hypothetical protein DSM110277_02008 [Sulfitobacter pontiacus]
MQEVFDQSTRNDKREKAQELQAFIAASNAAAISLSGAALKALLLLNGGAAIAMLGFVATMATGDRASLLDLSEVVSVLQVFALGAGLAVLATGFAYVVMYFQAAVAQSFDLTDEPPFYTNGNKTTLLARVYKIFHVFSVLTAFASLGSFGLGVMWTGGIVSIAGM